MLIIIFIDSKLLIISSNLSKNLTTFTILNVPQLERQGADLETKIEELQDNQSSVKRERQDERRCDC